MGKVNPNDYVVKPGATAVEVDLDKDVIRGRDGRRLTEKDAEAITDRVLRKRSRGRPSLSGEATISPRLGIRVSPETRSRLEDRATREGKKVSDVVRDAIDSYL